jgi:hypothetical protein
LGTVHRRVSMGMSNESTDFGTAHADRPPTASEEVAAERAADAVNLDEVAEHYTEMMEKGAEARGEGQIEPEATP